MHEFSEKLLQVPSDHETSVRFYGAELDPGVAETIKNDLRSEWAKFGGIRGKIALEGDQLRRVLVKRWPMSSERMDRYLECAQDFLEEAKKVGVTVRLPEKWNRAIEHYKSLSEPAKRVLLNTGETSYLYRHLAFCRTGCKVFEEHLKKASYEDAVTTATLDFDSLIVLNTKLRGKIQENAFLNLPKLAQLFEDRIQLELPLTFVLGLDQGNLRLAGGYFSRELDKNPANFFLIDKDKFGVKNTKALSVKEESIHLCMVGDIGPVRLEEPPTRGVLCTPFEIYRKLLHELSHYFEAHIIDVDPKGILRGIRDGFEQKGSKHKEIGHELDEAIAEWVSMNVCLRSTNVHTLKGCPTDMQAYVQTILTSRKDGCYVDYFPQIMGLMEFAKRYGGTVDFPEKGALVDHPKAKFETEKDLMFTLFDFLGASYGPEDIKQFALAQRIHSKLLGITSYPSATFEQLLLGFAGSVGIVSLKGTVQGWYNEIKKFFFSRFGNSFNRKK